MMQEQCHSKQNKFIDGRLERNIISNIIDNSGCIRMLFSNIEDSGSINKLLSSGMSSIIKLYTCSLFDDYIPYCMNSNFFFLKSMPYPIFVDSEIYIKKIRRADSLILSFFSDEDKLLRFSSNGKLYYSGSGILLNENTEPLMLLLKKKYTESDGRNDTLIKEILLMVNPSVFIETDKIVEKYIIRNIIPFMISNKEIDCSRGNTKGRIILKFMISDCINDIVEGNTAPLNQEEMNNATDLLKNNIDDYISFIEYLHNES